MSYLLPQVVHFEGGFRIILSGTGTDGAQGLRAISAAGGVTLVQPPETAKYDGMPVAAIDGCSVDMVIEPAIMGEELLALANFPRQKVLEKYQISHKGMAAIFNLLFQYKKVDFAVYKKTTITRRIEKRMQALKLASLEEYVARIQQDKDEVALLYKDILIGVTQFFRDRDAFDGLRARLIKYVEERPEMTEFRVWLPGTSTGEEAYSTMIILFEILKDRDVSVRMFATDIDDDALKSARRGVYNESALAEMSSEEISHYFTIRSGEYEIKKALRDPVVFSFHNLLADPPFKNIDLVVCRNLMIYFTIEAQRHVMPILHYALKDHGLLFLGKSENVTTFENLFTTLDRHHKIFRSVPSTGKPTINIGYGAQSIGHRELSSFEQSQIKQSIPLHAKIAEKAAQFLLPNLVVVNEQHEIVFKKGSIPFLSLQDGYVNYNLFKMLDPRLALDVRQVVEQVRQDGVTLSTPVISMTNEDRENDYVRVHVVPLLEERQELFIIYFYIINRDELPQLTLLENAEAKHLDQQLTLELERTREHMNTLVEELETGNEELQSTNEELQSANEELQSTNEELETSNEELQSTNEELQSAYAELRELYEQNDKIKENLRHVSQRYERVLDSINDGVTVSTLDGVFVRTNNALQQMTGLDKNALLTMKWHDLLDMDVENHDERYKQLVDKGNFGPYVAALKFSSAAPVTLSIREYLLKDDHGTDKVWSFATDITREDSARRALQISEHNYRSLFEEANIGFAQVSLHGRFLNINAELCEILGYNEKELLALTFQQITHPEDLEKDLMLVEELQAGKIPSYKIEKRYLCASGHYIWARLSVGLVRDTHQEPEYFVSVIENIDELKHSITELEQAQVVFNTTQEGIFITDRNSLIISVNHSFETITGYNSENVIGKPASILKSNKHPRSFYEEMWIQINKTGFWSGEVINQSSKGELYPAFLSVNAVKDSEDRVTQYIGMLTDISLLKQSQEKIDFLANHDSLTGLPNRMLFKDRLAHALDHAKRLTYHVALFYIDLDRFKVINDGLGHHVGDAVLIAIAERFKKCLRAEDMVARIGGDEFVVILEDLHSPIAAAKVAENLIKEAGKSVTCEEHEVQVGCSIGISVYPNDGIGGEELLRQADIAMYEAKEAGGNAYRFTSTQLSNDAFEKVTLENAIRDGLKNNHFEMYFQPIIELKSREVVHVESLIRWNHPELGLVMPGKFIPLAEESTLITSVTDYVVFEVFRAVQEILKVSDRPIKFHINYSVRDFGSMELYSKFKKYLAKTKIDPSCLIIELTESMFVKDDAKQHAHFERYEQLGIKIAIDDFGTGYSNLNSLSHMNFDHLKIHKSFIDNIGRKDSSEELVKATIAIADVLGHDTIAEGIETEEQYQFLLDNGCHYGQGYLFHLPMNLGKLKDLLKSP